MIKNYMGDGRLHARASGSLSAFRKEPSGYFSKRHVIRPIVPDPLRMAFTRAMGFCPETHEQGILASSPYHPNLQQQPQKNLLFPSYVVRASTAHMVSNASQLEINDIDDRCTKYQVLPRCDALSWLYLKLA
jgi:hypothetical protein